MRILGIMVAIGVVVLAAVWVIGDGMSSGGISRSGEEEWPAGLGTLASVESRLPRLETNDAARRLTELAPALDITFAVGKQSSTPVKTAIANYGVAQHMRAERGIEPPPAEVSAFLASHEAQIDALRDHLLRGDLAWDRDISKGFAAPIPNLLAHIQIARLLTARAYMRGAANDARAWDDLHAAARLARGLETRPELISQLIHLAMVRMVNGAAWKLPPANVPWLAELRAADHRRLLLRAFQYDTWMMWRHGADDIRGWRGAISKPYVRWAMADMSRRNRETAAEIAAITACGTDTAAIMRRRIESIPPWNVMGRIATPNLDTVFQRAFRSIAEREATANAMRILRGEAYVPASQCSDGAWTYDGAKLRFNRELRVTPEEKPMPLMLVIGAPASRAG
jgi:hypothetical protein